MAHLLRLSVLAALALAACAPSSQPASPGTGAQRSAGGATPKAVNIAINEDPGNFWDGVAWNVHEWDFDSKS